MGKNREDSTEEKDANAKVLATFCKATIQSILLYGSKSLTMDESILHKLNIFKDIVQDSSWGDTIKCLQIKNGNIQAVTTGQKSDGLLTIEEYIKR
jgi:hypothetical protein